MKNKYSINRKFNHMFIKVALLLMIAFTNNAYALGKLGHQLVCQLAFDHLSLTNQQKVNEILTALPKKTQQMINQYNYDDKNTPIMFANVCTWADAIKKDKSYDKYKSWHYANVTRNQTHITENSCTKNCLPQAIIQHQKQLYNTQNPLKKAKALMFLGHWLGDIHQPLHISYAEDWGGNKIKINLEKSKAGGKCSSMHWFWDQCIISNEQHSEEQWLVRLNKLWHSTEIKVWKTEQVWQWADESYQIVRQPTFNYCQLNNNQVCLPLNSEIVTLTKDYQEMYAPVIEKRMVFAAKRLANVLTTSL